MHVISDNTCIQKDHLIVCPSLIYKREKSGNLQMHKELSHLSLNSAGELTFTMPLNSRCCNPTPSSPLVHLTYLKHNAYSTALSSVFHLSVPKSPGP